jgi:hypothetical protein
MHIQLSLGVIVALAAAFAAVPASIVAVRSGSAVRASFVLVLAMLATTPSTYVVLGVWPELVDARFRTFKRLHSALEVGMLRQEILDEVERRYPAEGPRRRPAVLFNADERWILRMDSEGAREPNCESILIDEADGRASRIRYSAD